MIGLLLVTLIHGPADVASLTRASDSVAQAEVVSSESHWVDGQIFTTVRLRAAEALKGAIEPEFRVLVEGGAIGQFVQTVQGVAAFQPGEQVVVFLHRRTTGVYSIEHLALGKFTVQAGRALRDRRGLECVGCAASEPDALPLEDLRAQVLRK
jgi:hypothetical protein